MQNVKSQLKGFIKLNVSNVKDPQTGTFQTTSGEIIIKVEIEASKFEMKPKEASRLNKLA